MDLHSHLKHQFFYDDWANREVIGSLQQHVPPQKALRLMAHIVATEFVWLARLKGEADPKVWPEWGLGQTEKQQNEIAARWQAYLQSLGSGDLEHAVEYRNTKGERWNNSTHDILTHVVIHSAYHRGQIALLLREAGIEPAYTDYIQAVRTNRIRE